MYFGSDRQETHAIWRVEVDSGRFERVTMGSSREDWPTLARSSEVLAHSTFAERTSLELVDTATQERAHFDPGRLLYDPSIAPDRSSVVFTSNVEGSFDLWRLPLQDNRPAGEPVRLTEQAGSCSRPNLSPDGRWIAFQRVTGGQRDVWIVPAAGGTATNFTDHPAVDINPAWSPDGTQIAFMSNRAGFDQIWVARVQDGRTVGAPHPLPTVGVSLFSPSWSPDGARVGFVAAAGTESEVWTAAVDGSQPPRRLTEGANAQFAAWSRSTGDLLVVGNWGTPRWVVRAVDPSGGPPREVPAARLSDDSATLLEVDVSDDGQLLALLANSVRGDVWVLTARKGKF